VPTDGVTWVCLDVGETLVDETRVWATWADVLGVPRFTFAAALGGVIARGRDHLQVFELLGRPDWERSAGAFERAFNGFQPADLYPDALDGLARLRAAGHRVAIVANQPAARAGQLAALGVEAEVVAMSDTLGVAKPDPAFFSRVLELTGTAGDPDGVVYVGDRVDNDVLPACAAGMRAVWLRRGPWGLLQQLPAGFVVPQAGSLLDVPALL
jgi:HAD superfamily hydrolase (TIGR01549 family)